MKKLYSFLFIIQLLCVKYSTAQNIAINDNGALPDTTAMLDVTSTTKGFLTPRMTAAQRNAIASPAEGLMVYCTTDSSFYYYNNGWNRMGKSNEGWSLNGNAGTDTNNQFIGTTDIKPIHFRVNNYNAGRIDPTSKNTALGYAACDSITSGINNTALGAYAGKNNKTGNNNTFIGSNTDALLPGIVNSTAIGANAKVGQNNSIVLGDMNTKVGIGTPTPCSTGNVYSRLEIADENGLNSDVQMRVAGSSYPLLFMINSAGSLSAPTALGGNTPTGQIWSGYHNGTQYMPSSGITFYSAPNPAGFTPGRLLLFTMDNNNAKTHSIVLNEKGFMGFDLLPVSQLCNTDSNTIGADNRGINTKSIAWSMNDDGYVQALYNRFTNSGILRGNGLAVKIAGTTSTNTILDLSTGNQSSPGKSVMVVKGDGNVGINKQNPSQKLDIAGNAVISDSAGIGKTIPLQALDVKGKAIISDSLGIGVTSPTAQLQLGNTSQNRKIVLYSDAVNDHQFYGLGINASVMRYQASGSSASHVFYASTSASSSNELLRVKGNGKIGVGQSNPYSQFSNTDSNIVASDGFGVNSTSIAWATSAQGFAEGLYNGQTGAGSNGLSIKIAGTAITNTILDLSTGPSSTGMGAPVLTARGNGNIGINNISPAQKLDVKGNIVASDSVGVGKKIPVQALDIKGKAVISDSVGIGVLNPQAQLQLGNLVQNRKVVLWDNTGNDNQFYGLGINSGVLRYQTATTLSDHVFYAGNSSSGSNELLRIAGNGLIGIGISNPITKLSNTNSNIIGSDGFGVNTGSVTWDMNLAGYVQGLYNQSSGIGSNGLAVKVAGNTASNIVLDLSTGAQASTGTSIMQVRGNGNVSIGTTASTEKLSVNGAVKITDGGYGSITNNATTPVPAGGGGTMVYSNNHFFGWNGSAWKQLDN